ncbi:hypothetical protein [Rhizobium sullae]|uniref:hypothetical protein n=1 Tax=Rhizobium sullae TaxID=50338 RepID=UPI000B34DA04|nr:hypothetical protein [Rhizobium sullae]
MSGKKVIGKLQYGDRFGTGIANLARSSMAVAASSTEAEVAAARYAKWFNGDDHQPEPTSSSKGKFRQILPSMAATEIAEATKENLAVLGDDAYDLIASKLPSGNRMRKAIRSSILPSIPYLGSCKFGEVVTNFNGGTYSVLQFFIANFDGDLDTAAGASFYKPKSRDFDQMFFGVNIHNNAVVIFHTDLLNHISGRIRFVRLCVTLQNIA